jgi:hypothetical protein
MRFLCLELHRAARPLHKRICTSAFSHDLLTTQQCNKRVVVTHIHLATAGIFYTLANGVLPNSCSDQVHTHTHTHTRARAQHTSHTHHTSHITHLCLRISLHRIPRDLSPTSHIALLIRALCRGKAGPKKEEYTCELALFGDIDVEKSKRLVNPHQVFLTLAKKEDGYWPRVTKEKTKV